MTDAGNFDHAGDTSQSTTNREYEDDHATRPHTGIAGGAGVITDDSHLKTKSGPPQENRNEDHGYERNNQTEVDAIGLVVGKRSGIRKGLRPGKAKRGGVPPRTVDKILTEQYRNVIQHQRRDGFV